MGSTTTRRGFLAGAGVVGAGALAASCTTDDIGAPSAATSRSSAAPRRDVDVTVDLDDRVLAVTPSGPRLRRLPATRSVGLDDGGAVRWSIGGTGTDVGPLTHVRASTAPDGSFRIADPAGRRVLVVDADGAVRGTVTPQPVAAGRSVRPLDVAVLGDGTLAVADVGHLWFIGAEGRTERTVPVAGSGDRQVSGVAAIAADGNRVVVAGVHDRLLVVDRHGGVTRVVRLPDRARPTDVAVGTDAVYVSTLDGAVQRVRRDGSVQVVDGLGGHARWIDVDRDGEVRVGVTPVPSVVGVA